MITSTLTEYPAWNGFLFYFLSFRFRSKRICRTLLRWWHVVFSEQWFFNFQCDFPSPSLLHTPRTQSVHKSFCSSRLAGKKLCHDLLAVKMSDFSPRTENLSLFWVGWVEVWGKEQQQTVKSGLTPIIQFSKPVRRLSAKAVLIFGINLFIIIANATCSTRTVDIILHVAK